MTISLSPVQRQVGLLATCQALLLTNSATLIAINALAGMTLAPSPAYATLPITSYVLGSALSTIPASLAMRRIGRRAGFTLGGLFCILGALVCAAAMMVHSIVLLCLGTMMIGVYNAFGQYYRFAAVDVTERYDRSFKERAISLVLAGGIVGGIIGPETSKLSKDLLSVTFAGSYAVLILFALMSMLVVRKLDIPAPSVAERAEAQRPLAEIARQPAFIVAVMGAMISFGVMNLLMAATPLAMQACGFAFNDAAFVLEWHVIAMFAPGFFSGGLVKRFGPLKMMMTGIAILLLCVAIALHGVSLPHFWLSLTLLGVAWNFIFVSATTLLTECYRPSEKGKVQGINDFLVFAAMITSSFSSGAMFSSSGWNLLNLWSLPFLTLLTAAVVWLAWKRRALH